MTVRLTGPLAVLGAVIVAAMPACDTTSPERFLRAPIIRGFSPETPIFVVFVGDTVDFSIAAVDPDEGGLRIDFVLSDSVVAHGAAWSYVIDDTGAVDVVGRVFNRASRADVEWRLHRVSPENRPPVFLDVQPADPNPAIIVGNTLDFSVTASDPEGNPVSYIFSVDDSLVSGSNRYSYLATRTGRFSVKSFVSDGERFSTHEWMLTVLAEPDLIPPAVVTLTSLVTGPETGELVAEWIAVGDDSLEGLLSDYALRTSPVPIVDEATWLTASDRPGEPQPVAAGGVQTMVVGNLPPATLVYVSVRGVDDFGNLSPIGNWLRAVVKGNDVTGTIRDASTGDPIPDVGVRLASDSSMTDAAGRFALSELPDGAGPIRFWDEDDSQVYGAYFNVVTDDYVILDEDDLELWMIPNTSLETAEYASALHYMKSMTQGSGQYGHLLKTWDEPVDVYVTPFVNNGVDYEQVLKEALIEWETLTGIDLFLFVDDTPQLGFDIIYSGAPGPDFYIVVESDPQKLPLRGRITMRTAYDTTSQDVLGTIGGHETGHAIGMGHSNDALLHLMVGNVPSRVPQPSVDEIWLARVMYNLPRGQSLNWFIFD
jgi:hypothetical protein